jgi:hypothetical protein
MFEVQIEFIFGFSMFLLGFKKKSLSDTLMACIYYNIPFCDFIFNQQ